MMFKNSFKLLMSNFSTVWKLLLYKIIVVCVVAGLFCIALNSINSLSRINEFFTCISDIMFNYNITLTLGALLSKINALFIILADIVYELLINMPFVFVYLALLLFVILPYLWHLSDLAVTETLYGFMSSQTKFSFIGSLISSLNKSSYYSILLTAIILPINLILIGGVFFLLKLSAFGGIVLYILPLILVVYILLIYAFRTTFLCGWNPAITIYNDNVIKGFSKGFYILKKRFFKVLSTYIITMLLFIAVIVLFGFIGFVLLLTPVIFYISICGIVMFFGSQGMRYYVDLDTILTPKKLEETNKLKVLKFVV